MRSTPLVSVFVATAILTVSSAGAAERLSFADHPRSTEPEADPPALMMSVADLNVPDGPVDLRNPRLLERIVRLAYQRLSNLVGQSGSELRFELSEFVTYRPSDYHRVLWFDAVELPMGWVIDVTRQQSRSIVNGVRTAEGTTYEANWRNHVSPLEEAEWSTLIDATVADVLAVAASAPSFSGQIEAVTSFVVRATLDDRQRTYRASFLWQGSDGTSETSLRIADLITFGVETALLERDQVPFLATSDPGSTLRTRTSSTRTATASVGTCKDSSFSDMMADANTGTQDHLIGHHIAYGEFQIDCSCDTGCNASCSSSVGREQCIDEGYCPSCYSDAWTYCHDKSPPSTDHEIVQGPDSATCGGVVACAFKSCTMGCVCSASISVSISRGSVSVNGFSGSWSQTVKRVKTCSCEKEADPCKALSSTSRAAACLPGHDGDERTPGTPILIDLGRTGLQLTGLERSVFFDLDADGVLERISWTAAEGNDAFLVYDRDGNGIIDDGTELFGDAASQPSDRERHGFWALGVFDSESEGGNGDGWITPEDAIFPELALWWDRNANGFTDPGELGRLADAGVLGIDLGFKESRRKDRHGNLLRYRSEVILSDHKKRQTDAVDVFLLVEGAGP